ncbi:putative sulfate exporter family transporter [Bacillus sp. X1(2014)]|uniref:putative sulfate exporter family transporter n=1 Tax=Bacillus sp. X1(2014) TaxID=1565991 RepID=UPI0028CBBEE1|nr:putative sulfate exporter family transporter [Bacillus sp. X1(2014)]
MLNLYRAIAGAPAGQDALAQAITCQTCTSIPINSGLLYPYAFDEKERKIEAETKFEFPWFLIGFIVMSFLGSYIIGDRVVVPKTVMSDIANGTSFLLTMSMTGLGLNISLKKLRTKAIRPLITIIIHPFFYHR